MLTNSEWHAIFRANATVPDLIPWDIGAELTPDEKRAVSASIQEFQVGESSDGHNLQRCADSHAVRRCDPDYAAAIRLFIREEQRHGRDLGRFLVLNGVPLLTATPLDRLFRRLRRFLDRLEVQISVLITAEIIATVYYRVLRDATRSKILQALCDRILRDEAQHVAFQSEQLNKLRRGRSRIFLATTLRIQRLLQVGAVYAVWHFHRRVLRASSWTLTRFRSEVWREFYKLFPRSTRVASISNRKGSGALHPPGFPAALKNGVPS